MNNKVVPSLVHDRYRIIERIGGGSFGEIYKATDTQRNKPVAIKFVRVKNLI